MFLPLRKITFTRYDANKVIIQQFVYDYVCDLEIKKSYETLTSTAHIKLPRKLLYNSGEAQTPTSPTQDYINQPAIGHTQNVNYITPTANDASVLFRRGDSVKIEIGFYPNMQTRFVGFISKIVSTLPIEIQCEDSMWILKQSNVIFPDPSTWRRVVKNKSTTISGTRRLNLKTIMDGILSFVPTRINYLTVDDSMDLGLRIFNGVSVAQILEILKSHYGLYSYFKDDGVLYVGFGNNYSNTAIQTIQMDGNNGVVFNADSLQWTNSKDVLIKVRGKSLNTSTQKYIIYEAYMLNNILVGRVVNNPSEEDKRFAGDTIEKLTVNQSAEGLKKFVDNMLPTLNYNGFRGEILTLGEPVINHGDIINLVSLKIPERNGKYLVKGVTIEDGEKGYFQKISLGIAMQNQT